MPAETERREAELSGSEPPGGPDSRGEPGLGGSPELSGEPGLGGSPELSGEPEETVDALPVLAEVRPIEPAGRAALPAVQAAAVAATGFVAGAATIALVRRHATRKVLRSQRRRPADLLPIVGSRTFLVDVHLIAKPE